MDSPNRNKLRQIIRPGESLGRLFWRLKEGKLRAALAKSPSLPVEAFIYPLERRSRPWPQWVLKMCARLLHVHYPTLSVSELENGVQFVHWLILEASLDGTARQPPKLGYSAGDEYELLGKILGHLSANTIAIEKRFEPFPDAKAEHLPGIKDANELAWEIAQHALNSAAFQDAIRFSKAASDAEARTLDQNGQFRQTDATKVYAAMVEDWTDIERLSGPAELCRFLAQNLWPGKAEANMERVRQICSRFDVRFMETSVTSPPPAAVTSLPERTSDK